MQYRTDRYGNQLSVLGFGCMRFPRKLGQIDMAETEREILTAIEGGVNYFDTAYIYPGSEAALGQILEKNGLRDKVNIATKLPHYLIRSRDAMEKLFQEELKRLRTDHVDYYLMHMLTDPATWARLKGLGIEEWLREKKASGQIRQVGFSYHGNSRVFCALLDEYDWDFCQIQYNYLDEHSQAGRRGLHYAASKGIPVVIMEPLRGGALANVPEDVAALLPKSPVESALDFLWNMPQVNVVLSGMSTTEQVEQNMAYAAHATAGMLTDAEVHALLMAGNKLRMKSSINCTGCGYCSVCPNDIAIPDIFAMFNRAQRDGDGVRSMREYRALKERNQSGCIECGACVAACPQHLNIPEELKKLHQRWGEK